MEDEAIDIEDEVLGTDAEDIPEGEEIVGNFAETDVDAAPDLDSELETADDDSMDDDSVNDNEEF